MAKLELKPCKLCKTTNTVRVLWNDHESLYEVFCDNCKTVVFNEAMDDGEEDAIKIWNAVMEPEPERTCRIVEREYDSEGVDEWYKRTGYFCSSCGKLLSNKRMLFPPKYCHECGAKVVS